MKVTEILKEQSYEVVGINTEDVSSEGTSKQGSVEIG